CSTEPLRGFLSLRVKRLNNIPMIPAPPRAHDARQQSVGFVPLNRAGATAERGGGLGLRKPFIQWSFLHLTSGTMSVMNTTTDIVPRTIWLCQTSARTLAPAPSRPSHATAHKWAALGWRSQPSRAFQ